MASLPELPDEMVLLIFRRLQDVDLLSCASTCTRLKRISRDPILWRRRKFVFRGYCRSWEARIQSVRQYVDLYGRHLRFLKLKCTYPTLLTALRVAECVEAVTMGMCSNGNASVLEEFHMSKLLFDTTWSYFRHSKALLVDCIEHFLKHQRSLRVLNMNNNFISSPYDVRLMKALAKSRSTYCLETLDLVDFYSTGHLSDTNVLYLQRVLGQCHCLTELRLNYSYLYAADITSLCTSLQASLKVMVVYISFWDYTRHNDVITSQQWRQVKALIPGLEVTALMYDWWTDPTIFLDKDMPLVALEVHGGQCRYSVLSYADKAAAIVTHLAQHHVNRMGHLTLEAEGSSQVASQFEPALVRFLSACPRLRTVTLSESLLYLQCYMIQTAFKSHRARGVNITLRKGRSTSRNCYMGRHPFGV